MKPPVTDDHSIEGFDSFVDAIVRGVVKQQPQALIDERAAALGPTLLPEIAAQAQDSQTADAMFRMLAREICDRTPRPDLRFAMRKLIRPGRNEPCFCGSGRKYKHCCGPLEHANAFPELNLLPYVLGCIPRKQWAQLVGSAVDHESVAHAAHEMIESGAVAAAAALLEPWFAGTGNIPARDEWLLDLLLDAYTELDKPRKKQSLLESALQRGDRNIRSSAMQRVATMCADAGDFTQAWDYFRDAQREDSDSASLSHLEITLLLSQGDEVTARERARFWIARLSRGGAETHRELVGFLRQVAEQGEQAMFEVQRREWPELETIRSMLTQAPAPAVMHSLKDGDDEDAGHVVPERRMRKALEQWQQAFPQVGPGLTAMGVSEHPAWDDPEPWLECLRAQPLLWQSFDVLDDLVLALTSMPAFGIQQSLGEPLLARAEVLFDHLIEAEGAHGKRMEWGWHENRPALRLLAQRIVGDLEQPSDLTMARIERMLALNPNDNHGFRSQLMSACLQRQQYEQAHQLAKRFEEDTELAFSHALALWGLGRADDALRPLGQAHQRLPLLLPTLLAKSPRKPQINRGFVRYGGEDQAWLFRERELPTWEALPGALDWLRQARHSLN